MAARLDPESGRLPTRVFIYNEAQSILVKADNLVPTLITTGEVVRMLKHQASLFEARNDLVEASLYLVNAALLSIPVSPRGAAPWQRCHPRSGTSTFYSTF